MAVEQISTKHVALGVLGLGFVIFAVGFAQPILPFKAVALIISAICMPISLLIWKYGYLIIPMITKRANVVEVHDAGYEVTPAQDAIVKKVGNQYYASVFLHIKMYKSVTERSAEENMVYIDSFERAIAQIKFPVKIGTVLFAREIGKYKEDIETKKYVAQQKLQREREKAEPDPITIDKLEKEIAMYETQLARISSGERPLGLIAYAMTTGVGVTKEAAVAVAKNQAAEIKTLLANALNVEVTYLYGEDMKKCYEMEAMIPPTTKEVEKLIEE
ncbi:MAG: hypothetical protein QXS37_06425 [Candidatus Aenigmatarchaeota archaeon]